MIRPLDRGAAGWFEAQKNARSPKTLTVHARDSWFDSIAKGKFDFFNMLAVKAEGEGWKILLSRDGSRISKTLLAGAGVNLLVDPKPRLDASDRAGPRRLHVMPSYVWGFWYMDPEGVFWTSSLARATFEPDLVEAKGAEWFFNGVTGYMLRENVSKHPQPARRAQDTSLAAVVYCQDVDLYKTLRPWISTEVMVATTAKASAPNPIAIKLHPSQQPQRADAIRALVATLENAHLTEASLHDLNTRAAVVVTQNSAAGFEALMQRRPVITCAPCDFHHATVQAQSAPELSAAIAAAPARMAGFDYPAYLTWFLRDHCLEPQAPDFAARAWARIQSAAQGERTG